MKAYKLPSNWKHRHIFLTWFSWWTTYLNGSFCRLEIDWFQHTFQFQTIKGQWYRHFRRPI